MNTHKRTAYPYS